MPGNTVVSGPDNRIADAAARRENEDRTMKEQDIRPPDLIAENDRLHAADVRRIFSDRDSFVSVPCPACGDGSPAVEFVKKDFRFNRCPACETLYVSPRPAARQLADFYSAPWIKHWNDKIFPASEQSRREHIFKPRAERVADLCRKYATGTKTLLDVGAGFGTFCEEIDRLKLFDRVAAVEPSRDLAGTCRSKGIETLECPIEEVALKDVDVITNFELIEHLFAPVDFIRYCARVLSRNGLLIITTPNIKGFDLMVLGEHSENIVAPQHLNYFNPRSIARLLESCGMSVVEVLTPGKLDADIVRTKALGGVIDLADQPFLREVLVNEWDRAGAPFQEFLAANCLSSHMWVVAKKL